MGLGGRLALVFAAVAAGTAILVGAASYITTDRQVIEEVDAFLRERASEITDGDRRRGDDRGGRNGNTVDVPDLTQSPDVEVQFLDEDGEVVFDTGLVIPVNADDLELADDGGREQMRTESIDGIDYRIITEDLRDGGAVQVARSLEESSGLLGVLQARLLSIAGVMALVAGVAGWIVAQRTTRPLRALTDTVDEVAETKDFSVPVPATGSDEVGRLARGFNRMLGSLQESEEQQRQLVQNAAHELRTPLTSVTANIDWLIRASDLDAETRASTLTSIRRELGELNDVMGEVIELATDMREPAQIIELDLAQVARNCSEQFITRSGRQVEAELSPVTVSGDPDSLGRAITNLLSNADKYSPADAPIGLIVANGRVTVTDRGPGIPAEERQRVFDRFYRRDIDRSKPGSGLGLSIVAGIVENHQGEVFIEDNPGGGTKIGFTLPVF